MTDIEQTRAVLDLVSAERAYQRAKWGNGTDDEMNNPNDFVAYIAHNSTRWFKGGFLPLSEDNMAEFKAAMIKTAAVATAAAEYAQRILESRNHRPDVARVTPTIFFDISARFPQGAVFNTFRIGSRWFENLNIGDTVRLAYTGSNNVVATAEVVELLHTDWEDAKTETHQNHAYFGDHSSAAQDKLLDDLGRIYDFRPSEYDLYDFTVIGLRLITTPAEVAA